MARLAFKPDASFFRKIALGAVGAKAVASDLAPLGHDVVELERGSTDTKLWKDVKRKRVRIPDLICTRCGMRIECRAKTSAELVMSHSPTDSERSWDFGMVDGDIIAFPVCHPDESSWSAGRLREGASFWREKSLVHWARVGFINYFEVKEFRQAPPVPRGTKGVTEGSETTVEWLATFVSKSGVVEKVNKNKVAIRKSHDGRTYTWTTKPGHHIQVKEGERVEQNQLLAAAVDSLSRSRLKCPGDLAEPHIHHLLTSRERTQRFSGLRLARLRKDHSHCKLIESIADDREEDVYVRLEASSYLCTVGRKSVSAAFDPYLDPQQDPQARLEATITLGEVGTIDAQVRLSAILDDRSAPYFLRSAAAWSLGRLGTESAQKRLIAAFTDVDQKIRDEALDGIVSLGGGAVPSLVEGIKKREPDLAAGCAEALRQLDALPDQVVHDIVAEADRSPSVPWIPWLLGHLPRARVAAAVAPLQARRPELHYAITVLWAFVESWISQNWELRPNPTPAGRGRP